MGDPLTPERGSQLSNIAGAVACWPSWSVVGRWGCLAARDELLDRDAVKQFRGRRPHEIVLKDLMPGVDSATH